MEKTAQPSRTSFYEEPVVTSPDPTERRLARTLRIKRRVSATRKQNLPEEEVAEEASKSLLQQQLQQSNELIEKLIIDAEENITNIRVSNDAREVDRRDSEGVCREKVIAKLDEEAQAAHEMLLEIMDRWKDILKSNDPLDIHDELTSQREKCEEVIKQKDAVIEMLKEEIKVAENNFLSDQRNQVDDINLLTQRIEKQITLMRHAYRNELQLLENAISMERNMLMEANERKWQDLFKQREQEEEMNMVKRFAQIESYDEKLKQLRIEFEEKFRETKIRLENDVSNIQKELERIKALALINSEKLDYNYQILKKREDENIIIKSQQKRRINKLQDVINSLRGKIAEVEKNYVVMRDKLSEEIKKLHRSILEVESKADHFAKINNKKYCQIWELNETRIQTVLKKILDTDRILYEQQLGLPWDFQKPKILKMADLPGYKEAMEIIAEDEAEENAVKQINPKHDTLHVIKEKENMKETEAYRKILKHIMVRISARSDFLIEERLKTLLQSHLEEEKILIRIDNVFTALNIKKKTDIDLLMHVFMPYTYCEICTDPNQFQEAAGSISSDSYLDPRNLSKTSVPEKASIMTTASMPGASDIRQVVAAVQEAPEVIESIVQQVVVDSKSDTPFSPPPVETLEGECLGPGIAHPKDKGEEETLHEDDEVREEKIVCEFQHPLVIREVYVLKALKKFISKYYVGQEGISPMEYRLSRKRNTVSRLLKEEDVKLFWNKFANAYTNEMDQLWTGLFQGLKKYQDILKDRKSLSEDVTALRRHNQELRRILELHVTRNAGRRENSH